MKEDIDYDIDMPQEVYGLCFMFLRGRKREKRRRNSLQILKDIFCSGIERWKI